MLKVNIKTVVDYSESIHRVVKQFILLRCEFFCPAQSGLENAHTEKSGKGLDFSLLPFVNHVIGPSVLLGCICTAATAHNPLHPLLLKASAPPTHSSPNPPFNLSVSIITQPPGILKKMSIDVCFPPQLTLNGTIFELPKTQSNTRESVYTQQAAQSNAVINEFLPSEATTQPFLP